MTHCNEPATTFVLDGPFVEGSRGTTFSTGQDPLQWRVAAVVPERSFVIEMALDRAMVRFEWRFDALGEDTTQLTQRIVVSGDNANEYLDQIRGAFGATLAPGMAKIASEMAAAAESGKHSG